LKQSGKSSIRSAISNDENDGLSAGIAWLIIETSISRKNGKQKFGLALQGLFVAYQRSGKEQLPDA